MPQTQRFIVASFALIVGIGLGFMLSRLATPTQPTGTDIPITPLVTTTESAGAFKSALLPLLEERFGSTTSGYEPLRLMYVYGGFTEGDFDKVEAVVGFYEFTDGHLWYRGARHGEVAADDISDAGYETVYRAVRARLGISESETARAVADRLMTSGNQPMPGTVTEAPVANAVCSADAKQCADGSYVTRVGEACEFAACPIVDNAEPMTQCDPASRETEACIELYAPVCGLVQVECVTTPCNPVPETFSNSCFACMNDRVTEYTEGVCTPSE